MPPQFLLDLEVQDLHTVDHASLARAITQGIALAPPPFRIALFGPWGSGKSTILKMVQGCIEEENAQAQEGSGSWVRPLVFNAWEVESHVSPLGSLLALLLQHVPEALRYSREGERVVRQAGLAGAYLGRRWAASHGGVASGGQEAGEGDDFSQVQSLKDTFRALVELVLSGAGGAQPRLVLFVDDLDKCAPATVLGFIEGAKLFLSRGTPLILVFALDREILSHAIAQKYHHARRPGVSAFDAERYVEKIFEFNYDVPSITLPQTGALARELYERAGLASPGATADEVARELEAIERALALPGVSLNPRKIKRIFNKFVWFFASRGRLPLVPVEGAEELELTGELPALDAWLIWLLTCEHWREFRRLASEHGAPAIGELCNRVTGNPLFPHANQAVRSQFDGLPGLSALLDYYRGVFNANGSAHLPAIQQRFRARVHEFARIDRVLQLNGV